MAIDDGINSGGGGSGTPTSMCAISPTDTVSTFNNLLERINKLEQIISMITGGNLSVGQLSDLSQQVGWVYGVEYMGVPGWIQTEYGTLIPPPGFTFSGNGFEMFNACTGEYENFQGVIMDENGVLQFGTTTTGSMCGAKVQAWDDAYLASLNPVAGNAPFACVGPNGAVIEEGVTVTTGDTFTIVEAGWYKVFASYSCIWTNSNAADTIEMSQVSINKNWNGSTSDWRLGDVNFVWGASPDAPYVSYLPVRVAGVVYCEPGDTLLYSGLAQPFVATTLAGDCVFYAYKISD